VASYYCLAIILMGACSIFQFPNVSKKISGNS